MDGRKIGYNTTAMPQNNLTNGNVSKKTTEKC